MDDSDPYAFSDDSTAPSLKPMVPLAVQSPQKSPASPALVNDMTPFLTALGNRSLVGGLRTLVHTPQSQSAIQQRQEPRISAAKLYPELSEKLSQKSTPKPPDRNKLKRSKINDLEARIAQNKIKDKIKRQEHSLSGSDLQSPQSSVSPTSSSPKTIPANSPQYRAGISSMHSPDNLYQQNQSLGQGLITGGRGPSTPSPSFDAPPLPQYTAVEIKSLMNNMEKKPKKELVSLSELVERTKQKRAERKNALRPKLPMNICEDFTKHGIDSSDSDASYGDNSRGPLNWFPSDDSSDSDDSEEDLAILRTTRLALMKTRLRRRFLHLKRNLRATASVNRQKNLDEFNNLVKTIKSNKVTQDSASESKKLKKNTTPTTCRYDKTGPCSNAALPMANHCRKHIMYNVDQQIFDYCTGRNNDGSQCCDPVFNIKYDLALCAKHALIAQQVMLENSSLKKARRKTKPSALTRPPRRGKKRKPTSRLKPYPIPELSGHESLEESDTVPTTGVSDDQTLPLPTVSSFPVADYPVVGGSNSISLNTPYQTNLPRAQSPSINAVEQIAEDLAKIDRQLSSGTRPFAEPLVTSEIGHLPSLGHHDHSLALDHAAGHLLEDHDINEVLKKLPDEAFDFFTGKSDDYVPTHEETEALERALAEAAGLVNRTKHTLDQMQAGFIDDDELTKHITDQIIEQTLSGDHDHLGHPAASSSHLPFH